MAASELKPCQCLIVCIVVGAMSFILNSALLSGRYELQSEQRSPDAQY